MNDSDGAVTVRLHLAGFYSLLPTPPTGQPSGPTPAGAAPAPDNRP